MGKKSTPTIVLDEGALIALERAVGDLLHLDPSLEAESI
jgi:hypothetical protein